MFDTEPIIYLQSLGTPLFTYFMILITKTGSYPFLIAITIMVMFGIDFKRGFLLLQLLLWTGLIAEALKMIIAFPRPDFVDNRVLNLEYGIKNTSPFTGSTSRNFFSLPKKEVLTAFRLQDTLMHSPFGFPSGHTALTAASWGGAGLVFRNRMIKMLTPLMIVLIAFSRVYLGRHFIADVLGGAITGIMALMIFAYLLKRSLKDELFEKKSFSFVFRRQNVLFYSFMIFIPVILTVLSIVPSDLAGLLLGVNVAFIFIIRKGIPDDAGTGLQRVIRAFTAIMLFGLTYLILDSLFVSAGTGNYLRFTPQGFLTGFIPALTLWVSAVFCMELGLYAGMKNES